MPKPPLLPRSFPIATAVFIATAASACIAKPVAVEPPAALAAVAPLAVGGRQGWLPGRELRFGDFATRELKRRGSTQAQPCPQGCSHVELGLYSRRFDEAFRSSTQRVSFTLVDGSGAEADVQLVQRVEEERREWITRWFGLPTDFGSDFVRRLQFAGTVQPAQAGRAGWRLVVADTGPRLAGWAEDDTGQRLSLTPLTHLIGPRGPVALPVAGLALGYAFEREGRAVAAVALIGGGTVWLSPDLDADERLALAGLAALLLARQGDKP